MKILGNANVLSLHISLLLGALSRWLIIAALAHSPADIFVIVFTRIVVALSVGHVHLPIRADAVQVASYRRGTSERLT